MDGAGPSCTTSRRQMCGGNQAAIERTLAFGRELQTLSVTLRRQHGKNELNKKMLRVSLFLNSGSGNSNYYTLWLNGGVEIDVTSTIL